MMSDIREQAHRLTLISNVICDEQPLEGISDADLAWIEKKFAGWNFPLPRELIEIWRCTSGLPRHDYDASLLKAALGVKSEDDPDVDCLSDYDVERYGILNLGNAHHASFTMNREGMTSLETMSFDMQPAAFPYSFAEGFALYVEAVEQEVSDGHFAIEDHSLV
ncbi:hypothetical protein [Salipiger sp. PrR003]|uniref:hypothetical protein n=1 Tax=Salipiger sp. PrR003 TaxID=2706776 RepID=UPI0013DB0291|nr:hypothetical protein [Salipiger sp. PrR003]NDV50164.1 hypothetical protein [Salipiger sp. PrR003]